MFTKKEDLRCMDYVAESGTLLIGTEQCSIVTHNIIDMMNYMDYGDFDGIDFDMDEEYTDMSGQYAQEEEHYDPLEGKDVDSAYNEI